jgi:hypothetical protein
VEPDVCCHLAGILEKMKIEGRQGTYQILMPSIEII